MPRVNGTIRLTILSGCIYLISYFLFHVFLMVHESSLFDLRIWTTGPLLFFGAFFVPIISLVIAAIAGWGLLRMICWVLDAFIDSPS